MNKLTPLLLSLLFLLGACSLGAPSKPSRFYVLSPQTGETVAAGTYNAASSIGVGPVYLPDFLDRPQIITRTEPHRIDLAEFDRWGGDLNKNLLRVLSQNLMQRLGTDNVVTYPWQRRDNPDLQVSVRFFRFDGTLGQQVALSGVWQVLDGNKGCQLVVRRFDISEIPADGSYAAFVDALSRGVAGLSQAIAGQIAKTAVGC